MHVGSWLRELGLGQYEAAFGDNEIDETVLPTLKADDLRDLGAGIVGHSRSGRQRGARTGLKPSTHSMGRKIK